MPLITESAIPSVPEEAVKFVPAIPDAKSAMLSFFELLSVASMIAMLSALTSTAAADSSLRSSASVTAPLSPPPLKPFPAVTLSISPAEVVLVIVNVPAASS